MVTPKLRRDATRHESVARRQGNIRINRTKNVRANLRVTRRFELRLYFSDVAGANFCTGFRQAQLEPSGRSTCDVLAG